MSMVLHEHLGKHRVEKIVVEKIETTVFSELMAIVVALPLFQFPFFRPREIFEKVNGCKGMQIFTIVTISFREIIFHEEN